MTDSPYLVYPQWKAWNRAAFASYDCATEAYLKDEMRRCGCRDLMGLHVLEIGFGNGSFAAWAREHGAIYQGTEIIPELIAQAHAHGFTVQDASQPLERFIEAGTLDVVVAFDVLEHMPQDRLRDLLHSLRIRMKSGALMIARVPSGDSPFARAIQHGALTHRTVLGSSAVAQLAHQTGFEVVQVREPVFPLRGLGIKAMLRRLAVLAVRRLT